MKMGIAVIGASNRSTMIFDFLKRNPDCGSVVGVFDIIPEKGKCLLNRYEVSEAVIYDSLEQALEDKRVDAVFISTGDSQHAEPVTAALNAGKHIYCEKPLTTTIQDCDKIVAAAKNAKGTFYVGKNMRHGPVHKKLHEILQSGQLGKLLTIEANEYYYEGRTYFRRWNRLRKYGGGLWITKSCHDFDLLNWFAASKPKKIFALSNLSYYKPIKGAGPNCRVCKIKDSCPDFYDINDPAKYYDDPEVKGCLKDQNELARITEEATGQMRDLCLYNSDKDTFDNGMAVVEYDNDIRATLTVNVVSARATRQMRLMGTAGSAEGDMEKGLVTYWKRYSDEKQVFDLTDQMQSGHGGADEEILKDFFSCCQNGREPKSGWPEGRLALEVGLAARESSDKGIAIDI